MLPTTRVNCQLYDFLADGAVGKELRVTLTRSERDPDHGTVLAVERAYTVPESGLVELDLWPNVRGVYAASYRFEISLGTGKLWRVTANVPEAGPVNLRSIIDTPAPQSVDAAQQAVNDAQAIATGIADFRGDLNVAITTLPPGSAATAVYDDALTRISLGIPRGDVGPALGILGELADPSELPASGDIGDGYIIAGDLWTWNGVEWINGGSIRGPQGE